MDGSSSSPLVVDAVSNTATLLAKYSDVVWMTTVPDLPPVKRIETGQTFAYEPETLFCGGEQRYAVIIDVVPDKKFDHSIHAGVWLDVADKILVIPLSAADTGTHDASRDYP